MLIDERNVLDAQKIFVSVALINILKTPLSQLPFAMSTTMQASHSKPPFNQVKVFLKGLYHPNGKKHIFLFHSRDFCQISAF